MRKRRPPLAADGTFALNWLLVRPVGYNFRLLFPYCRHYMGYLLPPAPEISGLFAQQERTRNFRTDTATETAFGDIYVLEIVNTASVLNALRYFDPFPTLNFR